jgi:hypothetical protein
LFEKDMKYDYKTIIPLTLGIILLNLFTPGCTSYDKAVQSEFNVPSRLARLIARSEIVGMKIRKGISGVSPEDAEDYSALCGISTASLSTETRRENAMRYLESSLLNTRFNTDCVPVGQDADCISYSLEKPTSKNSSTPRGEMLVSFSSSPKRGIYNVNVDLFNPVVRNNLEKAIDVNAFTPAERECQSIILKKKIRDKGGELLSEGYKKGGELLSEGYNGLKNLGKKVTGWVGEKYNTTQDCLNAGHDAEYCGKALIGMQDGN